VTILFQTDLITENNGFANATSEYIFGSPCTHIKVLLRVNNFFLIRILEGVESELDPLGTSATNCPIVLATADCEHGEFGGIKIR
jgi:hypothetical protein